MENAKHIVKRLFEEPWTGNFEAIDEFISPDYVGHDPAVPEPIRGPAGVRDNIERYIAGFPGGAITVDEQIAEGDKVATRWTGRGTHTGELAGISPTGKDVTVSGLTISRFEGGKVVEEWTTWDTLGMLVQLGADPRARSRVTVSRKREERKAGRRSSALPLQGLRALRRIRLAADRRCRASSPPSTCRVPSAEPRCA